MKRGILITAVVLGLSLVTMLLVSGHTETGRNLGQEWGSIDGPASVWPAVLGFGSMNLALLSGIVLAVLISVTIGRGLARSRRTARRQGCLPGQEARPRVGDSPTT